LEFVGLALTPQNNDAFFREVDDNLRQDQMVSAARRWGPVAGAAIILALIALAIFLWWRSYQTKQAALASEMLVPAIAPLEQGGQAANLPDLQKLAAGSRPAYATAARFALAASSLAKGDPVAASATYNAIANDSAVPQPQRDLALIRAVQLDFDKTAPDKVIARLQPLATQTSAYFASAGELTALAWLKLGRKDKAGPLLATVAQDPNTPPSMRGRLAGLATNLGQTVVLKPVPGA
jgi:hypothetical protein